MKIYEIGTGYTSIPANKGAATEIVVDELSHAFIRQGQDVTVVDIEDPKRLPTNLHIIEVPMPHGFMGTDEGLGIKHKLKRIIYSISLAKTLRHLLVNERERIVLHFHNQYNAFFFYKLTTAHQRANAFVCYTNHSGAWNGSWSEIKQSIRSRYFQEAYSQKCADLVFVLNKGTVENIQRHLGISLDRICLIKNGVNTELYRSLSTAERREVRSRISETCSRYVFHCGSVCPNKGQLRAVQALTPFLTKDRSLFFCYAGGVIDSEYQTAIESFCTQHGIFDQVRYLGEKAPGAELASFYGAASLFVFPSVSEAFSLSVLESLACGVPVLQYRGAGTRIAIPENDGLMNYSENNEFSEKAGRLLYGDSNAYGIISKRARMYMTEHYSWNEIARQYSSAITNRIGC